MDTQKCRTCGHLNPSTAMVCTNCKNSLDATIKNRDRLDRGNTEFGTGKLQAHGDLILTELQTGTQFHIALEDVQQVSIGRVDRAREIRPTVDLTAIGRQTAEVSRHHATITKRYGFLVLIDHGSVNGTYLNGQRLIAEQARVLRENDHIRLGRITLGVTFQRRENGSAQQAGSAG